MYQGRRESKVVLVTPVLKVLSVNPVSKENLVRKARRERLELKGRRVLVASKVVTEEMDKRVKSAVSVHLDAKETQGTEALMVILETSVNVVLLELQGRREMLVAPADLARLESLELLDQRVRGALLVHPAPLDKKETLEVLVYLVSKESQEDEETMDQRALRGFRELEVKRVKWDQRV